MSFGRDVIITFLTRGGLFAFGVVQTVILARFLLPEGRGQLATLLVVPQFAVALAPLGVHWAVAYYLKQRDIDRSRVLQNGLVLTVCLGFLAMSVSGWVLYRVQDGFLDGLATLALATSALLIPVRITQMTWVGVFRGSERIPQANSVQLLLAAMRLAGILVALVALARGVTGVVIAMLAAEVVVAVVSGVLGFRGFRFGLHVDLEMQRKLLGYGLRIYGFAILLFVNYRVDVVLLKHFLDYEQVGYYTTATGLVEYLWVVPNALSFVLFPNIVGASKARRDEVTSRVCRITVALMFVLCGGLALSAGPAVRLLYSDAFIPATWPLLVLLPGIFTMSIQNVLGADLSARGRPGLVTVAAATGVVINIGLNLWWIPTLGTVGAGLASTVSYSVVAVMVFVAYTRLSGVSPVRSLLVTRADIGGILARLTSRLRRG